jgi:hypothetical protein
MAQRSVVDQVVGNVKTEASKRPVPIDPFIAENLLAWYRTSGYGRPEDCVFATNPPRGGKKPGQQLGWLSKVMQHIQPAAKRLRYHPAHRLARVPAHLHDSATGEWRRREGRAGTIASWLAPDHDGRIYPRR